MMAEYEKRDEKREEYTVCDIRECIYKLGDVCGYDMILISISCLVHDLFHHKWRISIPLRRNYSILVW